ncbi:MAG: riboflavin synthase [Desulfovibrio sp.]|jgi:riboflavin synthase|nr:riboflavin synthase [Desulfovibrio sp.]
MFTGLVTGMGEMLRVIPGPRESRFVFRPLFSAPAWSKGESVAVNGACLSVENFDSFSFTAYASQETLSRTNLSALTAGARVNLERALALGDRLGGHLVSGHVDGLAEIISIRRAGSSRAVRAGFPEAFASQVVPKGSVALDGISLTINHCGPDFLDVNLIPETRGATTADMWRVGQRLNFETDMIAKYVERMIAPWLGASAKSGLTMDFLRERGF